MWRYSWSFAVLMLLGSIYIVTEAGSLEDKEALFEEWLTKFNPVVYQSLRQIASRKFPDKPNPRKYYQQNQSILDVIRLAIKDHEHELNVKMEAFLTGTQSKQTADPDYFLATAAPMTCDSSVQCPIREKVDLVKQWHKLVKALKNDADSCDPCQVLFDGLQEMSCEGPWEPERDDLISLCENLLTPLLNIDPVICNGTITLQGQHIYCILREATTREMCESLNLCYPVSGDESSSQRRKMPWEVKDKIQHKLQKRLKRKENRRKKRQSGVIRVAQLSDLHIQPKYAIGAAADCKAIVCCLPNSIPYDGSEYARRWGEYTCNTPESTVRKFLERVAEFSPDFILYSGDNPPHNMWDETLTSQLECSNIVVNAIKDIIPGGVRVYPNIGNHEMYPTNLYSMRLSDTTEMNHIFTKLWHGLAGFDGTANGTWSEMSYYTVVHQPGLRILSINTNYDWYPLNFFNTLNRNDSVNSEQKAFIESTLADARANSEKVIIIGHHPIGTGSAVIRTARWWQQVAREYGDVIVLHVSGHTHLDEQYLVIDPDTDEARAVNLVAAVTTPMMNINPSMRVFDLDDTTFELLNYQNYIFDISQQNPEQDPEIVLSYDAKEEYNMTDLSPASWQDLTLRFLDDEILFQTWYSNRFGQAELGPCLIDNICGESCKISQICGIWFSTEDEVANCIDNWGNTTTPQPPPIPPIDGAPGWTANGIVLITNILFVMFAVLDF